MLSTIPTVNMATTNNQVRATTTNAIMGNEVNIAAGVSVLLGRMKVSTSASSFPTTPNFDPFAFVSPIQQVVAAGKTQCVISLLNTSVTPNVVYAMVGAANTPSSILLTTLSASKCPFVLNGSNPVCAGPLGTISSLSASALSSYTWGLTGLTYTSSGVYTSTVLNNFGLIDQQVLNLTINKPAQIKLFVQGYFTNSGQMTPVAMNQGTSTISTLVDNMTIKLHAVAPPYSEIYVTNASLNCNGLINYQVPDWLVGSSYYISVVHRSGIQTWSSNPVLISENSMYDFTTSSSKAFGNNLVLLAPGVYGIYNGDFNQDENADLADFSLQDIDLNNFASGNYKTDMNGDGNVDLQDAALLELNLNQFIYSQHP